MEIFLYVGTALTWAKILLKIKNKNLALSLSQLIICLTRLCNINMR